MLAAADEFVNRAPNSVLAKVTRIETLLDVNDDARAKLDVDSFTGAQQALYGRYYRGVMMARIKNFKGAWQYVRSLPPIFVQEDPRRAMTIAGIAAGAGSSESAGAILATLLTKFPEVKEIRTQLAAIRLAQNSPQAALQC